MEQGGIGVVHEHFHCTGPDGHPKSISRCSRLLDTVHHLPVSPSVFSVSTSSSRALVVASGVTPNDRSSDVHCARLHFRGDLNDGCTGPSLPSLSDLMLAVNEGLRGLQRCHPIPSPSESVCFQILGRYFAHSPSFTSPGLLWFSDSSTGCCAFAGVVGQHKPRVCKRWRANAR